MLFSKARLRASLLVLFVAVQFDLRADGDKAVTVLATNLTRT
jgi:hypothetical protein